MILNGGGQRMLMQCMLSVYIWDLTVNIHYVSRASVDEGDFQSATDTPDSWRSYYMAGISIADMVLDKTTDSCKACA